MKKLLTIILLCFISTFTFAKTDVLSNPKTIEIVKPIIKSDLENYKLDVKQEFFYNEFKFSCTAMYVIYITGANGQIIDSFSATYTVTLDDPMFICTAAMSVAQSMAWDKYYAAQNNVE